MKRTERIGLLVLLVAVSLVFSMVPVEAKMIPKVTNFVMLVDQSGSMFEKRFGQQEVKSTLAKDILLAMNERIPELGYTGAIQLFAPDRTLIGKAITIPASLNKSSTRSRQHFPSRLKRLCRNSSVRLRQT